MPILQSIAAAVVPAVPEKPRADPGLVASASGSGFADIFPRRSREPPPWSWPVSPSRRPARTPSWSGGGRGR